MAHILGYYEGIIEHYSKTLFPYRQIDLQRMDDSSIYERLPIKKHKFEIPVEELHQESLKILDKIKSVFYSERETSEIQNYVFRIYKCLCRLKSEVCLIAKELECSLVCFDYPKSDYTRLNNYYRIYSELLFIIEEINQLDDVFKEVGLKNEHVLISKSNKQIYSDHLKLKYAILNFREILGDSTDLSKLLQPELLLDYNIDLDSSLFNLISENIKILDKYFNGFRIDFLTDITPNLFNKTLDDYINQYREAYLDRRENHNFNFYLQIGLYLTNATKKKSKEAKEDFIVDFLIFNNLCENEILEYYKIRVYKLIFNNEANTVLDFINQEKKRLLVIAQSNKIRYFNASLIGIVSSVSLIKRIDDFFNEFILENSLIQPDYSNSIETIKPLNERVNYKGTAESLGLLLSLMIEVGIFDKSTNKTLLGKVFAENFSFNAKNEIVKPRTISDKINENNRYSDDNNISFIFEKIQHLFAQIKEIQQNKTI